MQSKHKDMSVQRQSPVLNAPTHGGMARLSGLNKYRDGIPARGRQWYPVLTGLDIAQLCWCDECRHCYAKPATTLAYFFNYFYL